MQVTLLRVVEAKLRAVIETMLKQLEVQS
jgi:hypothetical protein